jgi:hypothetical protein
VETEAYQRRLQFTFARKLDNQARSVFHVHRGVVHKNGIGGANQRRNFALGVALVAFVNFLENLVQIERVAFFDMFLPTALCASLRRGVEKDFQFRVWKHDGADVPPFHDHSAARPSALLFGNEYRAHPRDRSHARCGLSDLIGANRLGDVFPVKQHSIMDRRIAQAGWNWPEFDVRIPSERFELDFRGERNSAVLKGLERDRAIHGTAVEILIAQFLRHKTRDTALPRAGWSVNSDGQSKHEIGGPTNFRNP